MNLQKNLSDIREDIDRIIASIEEFGKAKVQLENGLSVLRIYANAADEGE